MKKITFLLAAFMLLATAKTNGQENQECIIKYNLFKGDYLSKKYNESFDNWMYLMDNCKDLSVNIYKYGSTLAEDVKKSPALAKRVYAQRLQYFPDNDPAKVHSDYATYLIKNKLASDDEIFELLEKAYKISPQDMGAKNIYRYFQGVTDKYKDVNPQKVFDTYDDVWQKMVRDFDYGIPVYIASPPDPQKFTPIFAYVYNTLCGLGDVPRTRTPVTLRIFFSYFIENFIKYKILQSLSDDTTEQMLWDIYSTGYRKPEIMSLANNLGIYSLKNLAKL